MGAIWVCRGLAALGMPESEKRPVAEGSDSDDEPIGKKLKVSGSAGREGGGAVRLRCAAVA